MTKSEKIADKLSQHVTRRAYTIRETCTMLPIDKNTVYGMVHRKELPSFRAGRKILIPIDAIERLISGGASNAH